MVDSQGDNIQTIVKAAGVTVEPYWPGLFAKLFEKRNIADLITNVGAGESVQRILPPILCGACVISAPGVVQHSPVIPEEQHPGRPSRGVVLSARARHGKLLPCTCFRSRLTRHAHLWCRREVLCVQYQCVLRAQ